MRSARAKAFGRCGEIDACQQIVDQLGAGGVTEPFADVEHSRGQGVEQRALLLEDFVAAGHHHAHAAGEGA